jgi:uncharacterized Ntn-hydrolase superfamily protein
VTAGDASAAAAPGPLFTTFSITARCPRTGRLGVAIATRAMAVASRCPFVRAGIGAVTTQAYTDPRLGSTGVRLLELGFSAGKVLRELVESDPHSQYRQLAVVDRDGAAAAHTGSANPAWAGHLTAPGVAVLGNGLAGGAVAGAMMQAFQADGGEDLEQRLLRALEAGRDAGGQPEGQRSSGLLVYGSDPYPWVDLRVDEHAEPVGELRRIYAAYEPLREYFSLRPGRPEIGSEQAWLARRADPEARREAGREGR